ncbi:hypothetical protein LTS18_006196 [Coniosporium uncinatum]|uniref:Uncharacterized protein n=1 Tax=Coniosporium uncinatum TaxID=93489 RepID=A0ACC3DDP8_9PEZI|nr:hypothetical protein LTS18_006196 [Coniosporium uncinatum]
MRQWRLPLTNRRLRMLLLPVLAIGLIVLISGTYSPQLSVGGLSAISTDVHIPTIHLGKELDKIKLNIPMIPNPPSIASASRKSKKHLKAVEAGFPSNRNAKIAKASMLFGETNELFERALESHRLHNEIYGYPMVVLRESVSVGYWNKLSWLLSLVVLELGKVEEERVDWLMYIDPSTILLNPTIPLHIFLPPSDPQFAPFSFIGARHAGELAPTTFFLRVSPWSVKLLVKAMAIPLIDPEAELGDPASPGGGSSSSSSPANMDGVALAYVLNETEFRGSAIYEPAHWFAARQLRDRFEGQLGDLMATFPGGLKGERWKLMSDCLDDVASGKWEVRYKETGYTAEIMEFWRVLRLARWTIFEAEQAEGRVGELGRGELVAATERLREVTEFTPDQLKSVEGAVEGVRRVLDRQVT